MSWEDGFEAAREAASRAPAAANPATIGEIAGTQWEAAGLSTVFGVGGPWKDARDELARAVEGASGMSLPELAERQGRKLAAIGWAGASLEQEAAELGSLAAGLTAEQQEKVKPHLDVAARARAIAAQRERQAADASERTYGLSGHAVGFLAGMARQAVDPVNLATMFVGGPLRGAVLPMLAREAGLGMAVQALQEPLIQPARAELGLEAGFGEAVTNILTAGIGNAGFAGLLRAGGWALRQARLSPEARAAELLPDSPQASEPGRLDGSAPEPAGVVAPMAAAEPSLLGELSPADFAAASRLIEREQLIEAISPDRSPAGRMLHGEAVEAATAHFERVGADTLARFDEKLAELDARLAETSLANAEYRARREAEIAAAGGASAGREAGADGAAGGGSSPAAGPVRARRNRAEPRPVSLGRFIAMNGGLRIDADVRHMGVNQMFVPGVGMVGRVNGRLLDRDLEPMLIAAGYLQPHDPNLPSRDVTAEVYDALEQEFKMKRPRYAQADADAVARLDQERAYQADGRLYEERLADEIEAQAETIRAGLRELGMGEAHPQDIAEAAELVVRGAESDWESALERIAIQRAMSEDGELPALSAIADDIPPGWEIDDAVRRPSASDDRRAAGGEGESRDRPGQGGGAAPEGRNLPDAGQPGAAPGGPSGDQALALPDIAGLLDRSEDAGRARARFADVLRAAEAAGGDLVVELDGGPVSLKAHLAEIKADADAAAALKDCLGQKGGDA